MNDQPKLKLATEDQKKGGWTIAPELLDELQNKISMYEDAPSWEGIELVLLAFHGLPLPQEKQDCDWCGEPATELSHPHIFDLAIGKKMCRGCWEHDRDVYKGSYGEDIGEFKPITA